MCAPQILFQPIQSRKFLLNRSRSGFAGKTNGELLTLAEANFDVFVTLDKGFAHQQNLKGREIAILLIRAKSARLEDLLPLAPACLDAIAIMKPGEIVYVGA